MKIAFKPDRLQKPSFDGSVEAIRLPFDRANEISSKPGIKIVPPIEVDSMSARNRSGALWGISIALALCLHVATAAALMMHWRENNEAVAGMPAIIVDLTSAPAAPAINQTDLPQGPQQDEAKAAPNSVSPPEKVELPPQPDTEPLPVSPPVKPADKPTERPAEKVKEQKQRQASLASAPATARLKSIRASAPAPGAAVHDFDALPNWKSQLVAALERNKGTSNERGIATLAFSIDRRGGVHHARIARSSGSRLLDNETMAMLQRAAPLPPPPPEIAGAEIPIEVPIRYNMH
jgi:protein TonB